MAVQVEYIAALVGLLVVLILALNRRKPTLPPEDFVSLPGMKPTLWWFVEGACRSEKIRNVVRSETNQATNESEHFIVYMNEILAKRAQVDADFRARKGWVST